MTAFLLFKTLQWLSFQTKSRQWPKHFKTAGPSRTPNSVLTSCSALSLTPLQSHGLLTAPQTSWQASASRPSHCCFLHLITFSPDICKGHPLTHAGSFLSCRLLSEDSWPRFKKLALSPLQSLSPFAFYFSP